MLIVQTGTTLPQLRERRGDYDDWIAQGLGLSRKEIAVVRVDADHALPEPSAPAGVVVTGSSALVSRRETWSERTAAWLAEAVAVGTPVLGICYGHQLLAHGLGGRVDANPRGREIGTIEVELRDSARADPLLGGFAPRLTVQATHVESVLELPPGARLLGSSARDPHAAFAVGAAAWGVQFHPEFDAAVMSAYLEERHELLCQEGLDADALRRAVRDSPHGTALLRRFAELVAR